MAIKSNLNTGIADIDNGSISFEQSINDYPTVTVVEYVKNSSIKRLGSGLGYEGLNFFLESVTIDTAHIEAGLAKQVTYNYVHVAKIVYEFPVKLRDFVDKNRAKATSKRKDTYVFQIGDLIQYARKETGGKGDVASPDFEIEIPKQPSEEDTATVKQYCDSNAKILARVYQFDGNRLSFTGVGKGRVPSKLVSNVSIVENLVPTYRKTTLTWNQSGETAAAARRRLIKLSDSEYCTYEGDHNPHLPPPETADNTKVPRDLSVMVDNSGNTKQFKITKYKYNQPAIELSGVFGYAHAALELVSDPEKSNAAVEVTLDLLSDKALEAGNAYQELLGSIKSQTFGFPVDAGFDSPMVWRLVQVKETRYIYKPLHNTVDTQYKNPDGTFQTVQVAEGYQQLLNSNLQVLAAEESNGWEIKRFAQEDASNWASGSLEAWRNLAVTVALKERLTQNRGKKFLQLYNLALYKAKVALEQYLYRKVPLYERIDYTLAPYSKYYENADEVNWEVSVLPKNATSLTSGNETEEIPILFPDPDWAPQLMILAKSRYKSSIGLSGNPEYDPLARNYFGSNPITLTTGSEEYEFTKYSVLPSKSTRDSLGDMYRDFTDIGDILDAISDSADNPGTFYSPHPYMTVEDYGLKGNPTKNLSLNISSSYPTNRSQQEDIFLTQTTYRNAQDHSYKSNITTANYTIAAGRPPGATIRKPSFSEEEGEDKTFRDTITLISSEESNPASQYITSVNIESARTREEALKGAKFELALNIMTSGSSVSGQLSFEQIRRKDMVNARIDIPQKQGSWIIRRISKTVQVVEGIPFAQPIQFEAGEFPSVSLNYKTIPLTQQNNKQPAVKIRIDTDLAQTYGTPASQIPADFSRWLDIS